MISGVIMKKFLRAIVEPFLLNKMTEGKVVPHVKQPSTQLGIVGVTGAAVYATQATNEQEALIAAAIAIINLYFIYKPSD